MEKELRIYESGDGQVTVEALCENGAVWLTMEQICELFGENEVIIGGHLTTLYAEGELREADAVRKVEGNAYYRLDAALTIGFRVRSKKGQMFRIWAMKELREKVINE